jgi:hypothetical protein
MDDVFEREVLHVAHLIRSKIHSQGTEPRLILASLKPRLERAFLSAARRRLREP